MPAEGVALSPAAALLSPDETIKLAAIFVRAGVQKIRLTGGEPTVRPDLVELVADLDRLRPLGLKQIGMTTNGIALTRQLSHLRAAGLDKINLSLDTLDRQRFIELTRRDGLHKVLRSIDEAIALGYTPLKLNCVVMRGVNDHEVCDFSALTLARPIDVRFIEFMPFDDNSWSQSKLVPSRELLASIERWKPGLQRVQTDRHDVARTYEWDGAPGSVSFVSSMTEPFCGGCNRIRLTADGSLKVCLFGGSEVSLRDAMRAGASDDEILDLARTALSKKHAKHAGLASPYDISLSRNRPMTTIGG